MPQLENAGGDLDSRMQVAVFSYNGQRDNAIASDLVKPGAIYGDRVVLYDPIFIMAALAEGQPDPGAWLEEQFPQARSGLERLAHLDFSLMERLRDAGVLSIHRLITAEDLAANRPGVLSYLEKLSDALSDPTTYVMVDRLSSLVLRDMIGQGLTMSPGARRRSKRASTAAGLLGKLPSFATSQVEEVLGVREELKDSLPAFRRAVAQLAMEFTGESDSDVLFDEIEDAWTETVEPAVQEIRELSQESRFVRRLLKVGATSPDPLVGGGIGVATAMATGTGSVAAAVLASSGALLTSSVKAAWEALEQRREIHKRAFYLLYRTDELLRSSAL